MSNVQFPMRRDSEHWSLASGHWSLPYSFGFASRPYERFAFVAGEWSLNRTLCAEQVCGVTRICVGKHARNGTDSDVYCTAEDRRALPPYLGYRRIQQNEPAPSRADGLAA